MTSPGKPSSGRSVPEIKADRLRAIEDEHDLIDPTRLLYGTYHQPNLAEINDQNPKLTRRLLAEASAIARMRARIYAYGLERIPESGVFIVAATHVTQMDVFVPMMALFNLGRRPRFMAKEELSHWPFVGWALKNVGMQPVPRRQGKARAIEVESVNVLTKQHRPLVIWPEGTLTRDPAKWPMSLKVGLAEIALAASKKLGYPIPIFPTAVWGGASINNAFPWPRKPIVMGVDRALDYSDLLANSDSWRVDSEGIPVPPRPEVQALTDRVRARMEAVMSDIRGEEPPAAGMWDYKTESRVPRPKI